MSEQAWYKDGLQFTCSECGDCCTGAPGYVWVNKAEIEALAATMVMDVSRFASRYVRKVGIRTSLVELANGDCIFFDNRTRRCKVYQVRPRQCRTWPFWKSNVRTPKTWAQTCAICPGSGKGRLLSVARIKEQLAIITV